jgi:hypothetical protein
VLPEGCESIECSVYKECEEITKLNNPEVVEVKYLPTDINEFAVVVFMVDTTMRYDFTNKIWEQESKIIESTKQSDRITVAGAPEPPKPNILAVIKNLLNTIKNWICINIGWFC